MNSEVRLLFHRLADLSPEERERAFQELGSGPELRAEVESLLKFDLAQDSDLTGSVSRAAVEALASEDARELSRCGPYRLDRLLGSGGMGAVYLAERSDGEVQQKVAVKLLRAGEHRAGLRQRFLKERQFLASLRHSSIVHMVDAGKTADGRPYLVMEYVDGTPIDVYASGIDLRRKLALFLHVCQGVSHAHQQLIIHRDLKPSNILVDATGQPKLLDFGIAKLLDETGDQTRTVERLLTPGYASPEQLSGGLQTTATDIYSLGAILYKITTGRLPHESQLLEVASGKAEITPARRLNPSIPEDLDFILRRALRHEPESRYGSVEALANDLRALLDSRPVQARSGDSWYRTRKFLRRYWLPVAAATLVVASLSAGLYVANRQRLIAERRFGQLHEVSKRFLDLDKDVIDADPKLRIRIVSLSVQYLESLGREALGDRALALEIGDAYVTIARIQGVPEWNQQGRYGEAEQSLAKANAMADSVLRTDPDNRGALWLSANIAHDRAVTAYAERAYPKVFEYSPKVVAAFGRLERLGNMTRREINGATYMYGDLAEAYLGLHRFADAVRFARLGIEISQNNPTVPGPRAQAFTMLAGALMYSGEFEAADVAMRESRKNLNQLQVDRRSPRYIALTVSQTRCREGLILGEDGGVNLNRPLEAAAPLEEAFEAAEAVAKGDANDSEARSTVAIAGHYLGDVLRHSNPKRALEVYDHSLMRVREVPNDVAARRLEALLLAGSSYAARWIHHDKDASERIAAALRLLHEIKDYPAETIVAGSESDAAMRALADHYADTGQPGRALETYQELFRKIMASNPHPENDLPNAVSVSRLYASLAMLFHRMGKEVEARPLEAGRLELWRQWSGKLPDNPFVKHQLKAAVSRSL
jgi:serine/threonine protein kinase